MCSHDESRLFQKEKLMNFSTGTYVFWVMTFLLIMWTVYRVHRSSFFRKQVVALKAGETFVGVVERRRGQYVFIGNDLARYQDDLTPEEMSLLKQEFYKGYE
jgi:hypothetical protein